MFIQDLLKKNLPHPVPLMVIAKDGGDASDIGRHLHAMDITRNPDAYSGGFTDYVINRHGEKFLKP